MHIRPTHALQIQFLRLFRRLFPALAQGLTLERGYGPESVAFSAAAPAALGRLQIDLAPDEITVFTGPDHRHFSLIPRGYAHRDAQLACLYTCQAALHYLRTFMQGDIIIEYAERNGKKLAFRQYHRSEAGHSLLEVFSDRQPGPLERLYAWLVRGIDPHFLQRRQVTLHRLNWFGEVG